MSERDIVVIGASAGGIEACRTLLKELKPDFEATIFIVVHISATAPSVLPRILGREMALTIKNPSDGEVPQAGFVYVAP
ncbi:chemotaxis protein CheB, partial [Acinetobacter baumannii]